MEILKNVLSNKINVRTEKNFPIEGIEFIDVTPIFMDIDMLSEVTDLLVNEIIKHEVDYIVAPEARGFLLGTIIAKELNIGVIPVRKKGKLPPTSVEATFEYEKEYGKDYMELPKLLNENYLDKKFYIVDDIYATGNTMNSIEKEIEKLGGKVIGKAVIMNIPELNNDNVFSLIDIKEKI